MCNVKEVACSEEPTENHHKPASFIFHSSVFSSVSGHVCCSTLQTAAAHYLHYINTLYVTGCDVTVIMLLCYKVLVTVTYTSLSFTSF